MLISHLCEQSGLNKAHGARASQPICDSQDCNLLPTVRPIEKYITELEQFETIPQIGCLRNDRGDDLYKRNGQIGV
jgi:hypothetical protein